MPRIIIGALLATVILGGCGRSAYDELTRYKNAATPADAELQACLDTYNGRCIHVGEGYGHRLPFDSVETRELLLRVQSATEELRGVETPEVARSFAEDKIAAAEEICGAFELLDEVTRGWEDRLSTGLPAEGETEPAQLSSEDAVKWRGDMARVDASFESADRTFDDAALALGAAIIAAHDEEY